MAGGDFRGQGATEYLVMLGIALIVAFVVVSLINFYPGTVSDNQITENQIYWRNAKPLAVSNVIAYPGQAGSWSYIAMTVKNTGDYPVTLTKIVGKNRSGVERFAREYFNADGIGSPLSTIVLNPGKAVCFGKRYGAGITSGNCPQRNVQAVTDGSGPFAMLFGGVDACKSDGTGIAKVVDFGFEYNETIGGNKITKRQVGPLLLARCQLN